MMRRTALVCRSLVAAAVLSTGLVQLSLAQTRDDKPAKKDKPAKAEQQKTGGEKLVPLELKLPRPAFKGTPKHVPPGAANLEKPRKGPRPPLMVPRGTKLLSAGKKVTSSDTDPIIGEIKFVTDGDKEAHEGGYVELGPGLQWVQIDLGKKHQIHALLVWHYHGSARVYHDVVVQVSDDEDFISNVRTVFSNDHDNSSGLGLGDAKEYWDTYEGRLIDAKGVVGRYVRLYSKGSTADDQNHYTEVEVHGLPVK